MMSSEHGTALGDRQGSDSSHGMVGMDAELKGRDVKPDEWAKEDLTIRKKYELKLLKKYDRSSINSSKECWFLVDCVWLNAWSEFVNTEDGDPPGPMSTKDLLDAKNNPLPNLKARIDYRGLSPSAYFILRQLHGADKSPDIPRYTIDIYKPAVPVERLVGIQMRAVAEASVQINRVRPKWLKWDLDLEEEEEKVSSICCGLTKEHLEAFIYWAIHCWSWSRKSSGRDTVSYRQYRPLKGIPDDTFHGNSTHSTGSRGSSGVRNVMHDSSTHSTVSNVSTGRGRSASGGGGLQNSSHGGSGLTGQSSHGPDDEDSSDDDDDGFAIAPADRDHEKGTWLYSFTKK